MMFNFQKYSDWDSKILPKIVQMVPDLNWCESPIGIDPHIYAYMKSISEKIKLVNDLVCKYRNQSKYGNNRLQVNQARLFLKNQINKNLDDIAEIITMHSLLT